jgi:cytoskeletal protein CcmA (bactofilin family)
MAEKYRVENDAATGAGVPATSRLPARGASSSQYVAQLSTKLAKQRKLLDELSSQKAQSKSAWTWWHVVGLVLFNNMLAVGFGFGAGSMFFGVGWWEHGWAADTLVAEGLIVSIDGRAEVVLERTSGLGGVLIVEAGDGAPAQLRFADVGDDEGDGRFGVGASGPDAFAVTDGAGVERVRIQRTTSPDGEMSETDILLNTPGGALNVGGDFSIDGVSMRTHDAPLTLTGRGDVVLDPAGSYHQEDSSGAAMVSVDSAVAMEGGLSVGDGLLVVEPTLGTVRVGTADRPADLSVRGPVSGEATLRVDHGLAIQAGNVVLGNVLLTTQGDLVAAGSEILFGSSKDDHLHVRGDISVTDPDSGEPEINVQAATGDISVAGNLQVDSEAHLMGDVILGAGSTDTVIFDAMTTEMRSLRASGSVTLGDDDDDTVTVFGRFVVRNDDEAEVISVVPSIGDVKVEGTVAVTGASKFDGSAQIGAAGETIDVFGSGTFVENVTAHQTFRVDGDSHFSNVFASNLSLSGNLQLANAAGETTFRVDPSTGDVHSEGSLYVSGDASFVHDIILGTAESDIIEFRGSVDHFAMPLSVDTNARLERDVHIQRATSVEGDAYFSADLTVNQDVTIGGDITILGDLTLRSGPRSVFFAQSDTGNIVTEGSIRVRGDLARFGSDVHIDSTADFYGKTVVNAKLDVSQRASIGGSLAIGGDLDVGRSLLIADTLKVAQDVWLGGSGLDETSVKDGVTLLDQSANIQFSAQSTGDVFVRQGMKVVGPVTFAGSTTLGAAGGSVTVHSTSLFRASMTMADAIFKQTLEVQSIDMVCESDLTSVHETLIASSVGQAAVEASADLHVSNTFGSDAFAVSRSTGDVLVNGNMKISGDINLEGHLTSPDLRIFDATIDQIVGSRDNAGVTIEGVLFSQAKIAWNKVHEVRSLITEHAVMVDGAKFQDGRMRLEQSEGHADGTDIVTLTNTARSLGTDMALTFKQAFHDEVVNGASAESSSFSAEMSDVIWTEDLRTHNSHLSFKCTSQGTIDERMRITSDGDLQLNPEQNRIVLRASGGVDVAQNVAIGGQSDSRGLTIKSQEATTLRIQAGGSSGARVQLSSPFGQDCIAGVCSSLFSTFELDNEGLPPMVDVDGDGDVDNAPKFRISSGGSSLFELTDLGGHAELYITGSFEVGTATSAATHTYSVQSGAASELFVDSSNDAAVVISSGKDRQAQLILVDPATDGEGNTFVILNDGGNNEQKNLCFADGDGNTMARIEDKGESGDLLVTGDGVVGSMHVAGDRKITVQSSSVAEINVVAGSQSDALLTITSGPDQESSLVLVDPALSGEASTFHVVNTGSEMDYPTLSFTDGTYEMMIIVDKGDTGDIHLTGSALVGGPSGVGERVLTIASATESLMSVRSTSTGNARSELISGGNQNAKIVLTDSDEDLKTFEIFNEGAADEPTLTFCAMSPCETKLMQIVRREPVLSEGSTGDFIVNGNALLGGEDAVGTRTLRVLSSLAAEIKVLSGANDVAKVVIQSGPDMDSKLTLIDPALGDAGSVFEIVNRGAATLPTLEVTDGDSTLLTITDQGSCGDLLITGSGLFGGSSVQEDRVLSVTSAMQADLGVRSGAADDATVTVTAGVDKKARLVLSGALVGGNTNRFEIIADGSENVTPKLIISDGTNNFIEITDTGDTTGDLLVSGNVLFGPHFRQHSCVETAVDSVPTDVDACVAIAGTDLDTPDACGLVLTDDPDDGDTKACSYTRMPAGPRLLSVQSGEQASVDVVSGDSDDSMVKIMSGVDKAAQLLFVDEFSNAQFVLHNDGSATDPTFRLTHGTDTMLTITDRRNVSPGDLYVTGSATFGTLNDPCRQLGHFETCGSSCVPRPSCRERSFTVQSTRATSVSITSTVTDASVTLTAGSDGTAKFVLEDVSTTSSGTSGSLFEFFNDGVGNRKQLSISDGVDVLVNVVDQLDTALLQVAGSGTFGLTDTSTGEQTVTVQSSGAASGKLTSAISAESYFTISSGPDSDAKLGFIGDPRDCLTDSATHSVFDIVLSGDAALAEAEYSALDITDGGAEPMLRVVDAGTVGDMELDGTLECVDLMSGGDASLGNDLSDQVTFLGHLTTDLIVDANQDGNRLTLAITDPAEDTQISFPDESGTVLTSVSVLSRLTTVGQLSAGSIESGFGAISTASNIETLGTIRIATCGGEAADPVADPDCSGAFAVKAPDDSRSACPEGCTYTAGITTDITAVGTVTASGEFRTNGDTYLGDSAEDKLVLNGLVTTYLNMGFETSEAFGPEIDLGDGTFTQVERDKSRRVTFMRDVEGTKQTSISARFNPSTIDSPPGERLITIPDVPSGGSAHITIGSYGQVQTGAACSTPNCLTVVQGRTPGSGILIMPNELLMDVTAGYIKGPSGLAAGSEEQIGLINRLIKPDTLLIANIADYGGTTGMPYVSAVAVDPSGGRATIVVRNIATDPADAVTVAYKIAWSLFN